MATLGHGLNCKIDWVCKFRLHNFLDESCCMIHSVQNRFTLFVDTVSLMALN